MRPQVEACKDVKDECDRAVGKDAKTMYVISFDNVVTGSAPMFNEKRSPKMALHRDLCLDRISWAEGPAHLPWPCRLQTRSHDPS